MKKSVRLLNFIIDTIFYFILVIVITLILKNYISKENLKIFLVIFYYLYYLIMEFLTGQTVGKMITKTRIFNAGDDSRPGFLQILIRTLARIIPIDIFSYLFTVNGIHDNLSKTYLKKI